MNAQEKLAHDTATELFNLVDEITKCWARPIAASEAWRVFERRVGELINNQRCDWCSCPHEHNHTGEEA